MSHSNHFEYTPTPGNYTMNKEAAAEEPPLLKKILDDVNLLTDEDKKMMFSVKSFEEATGRVLAMSEYIYLCERQQAPPIRKCNCELVRNNEIIMRFGKHSGLAVNVIANVFPAYMEWLMVWCRERNIGSDIIARGEYLKEFKCFYSGTCTH